MERLAKDKRSSLLKYGETYSRKKFYSQGSWLKLQVNEMLRLKTDKATQKQPGNAKTRSGPIS
jgi:hypothetical protein